MQRFKLPLAAVAAASVMAFGAPAGATEMFDELDQAVLDTFGTDTFGVITDQLGDFVHTFTFETTAKNSHTSSSVVSIWLPGGGKDIDFTAIDLDGVLFEQHSADPEEEAWDLNHLVVAPGTHTITVRGAMVTGPSASYTGTLNLAAVPEPTSWALMILGFGATGYMIRTRRRNIGALA